MNKKQNPTPTPAERLQKIMSRAGVASRRECETMIQEGRVTVNGEIVRTLGTRIAPHQDQVRVDGKPIRQPDQRRYILLHKPTGVVTTVDDPQGRPTVLDLVQVPARVFPVGRLDMDSEGLLLLTNDGPLTHHLTHPRYEVEKEYHAQLNTLPDRSSLHQWREGVLLDGVRTAPATVEVLKKKSKQETWLRIVMREGRKRQIREVARLLGYHTLRLIRVREGALLLGDLPAGKWRDLRPEEVQALQSYGLQASGE